jgi:hypothetical protein
MFSLRGPWDQRLEVVLWLDTNAYSGDCSTGGGRGTRRGGDCVAATLFFCFLPVEEEEGGSFLEDLGGGVLLGCLLSFVELLVLTIGSIETMAERE